MTEGRTLQKLNLFALVIAAAVLVATGVAWWRDRVRTFETPRWEAARYVALAPAEPLEERERWVVAVSLACPHCQAHLRALALRTAPRERPPALTALVVDQPRRPTSLSLGVPLAGGVWWDSTQVWREAWGRRAYGETFRFSAQGELLSSTPAGVVPDSSTIAI